MAGSSELKGSRHMLHASSELSSKATEDDGAEMSDRDTEVKFAMGGCCTMVKKKSKCEEEKRQKGQ